jgi:hypothetical protein
MRRTQRVHNSREDRFRDTQPRKRTKVGVYNMRKYQVKGRTSNTLTVFEILGRIHHPRFQYLMRSGATSAIDIGTRTKSYKRCNICGVAHHQALGKRALSKSSAKIGDRMIRMTLARVREKRSKGTRVPSLACILSSTLLDFPKTNLHWCGVIQKRIRS